MCGGVEAREAERVIRIYFPNPKAAFPVMLPTGELLGWVPWGRRREQPGSGPPCGWAKLETVERGGWEKYSPQRAFGLVQRFMEKDDDKVSHWFDLEQEQALECLLIGDGDNRRVYVVTSKPPEGHAWVHDRWPVIRRLDT